MDTENKKMANERSKNTYTGLGLIFGTAIGTSLSMIITGNVIWGGIGTAVGLILGAGIDGYKKN